MKKFLMLTKINFKNNLSSIGTQSSGSKKTAAILYSLLAVYLFGFLGYTAYEMGSSLSEFGMQKLLLALAGVGSVIFILLNCVTTGFGYIFRPKDYDLTASFPVSSYSLFLSKLVSYLILFYIYQAVIYLPFVIFYFVFAPVTAAGIVMALLGFVLLPLLPAFIGVVLSVGLNLLLNKLKWQNALKTVGMIVFLAAVMYISMNVSDLISGMGNSGTHAYNVSLSIYYPILWLVEAITTGAFLPFLYFVLINVLPFLLLVFVVGKYYFELNSFFASSGKSSGKRILSLKKTHTLPALVGKEVKRLTRSTQYFVNSCLGPILIVILAVVSLFTDGLLSAFGAGGSGFFTLVYLSMMLLLLSSPLSVTISLEGESLWILKSLPVSARTVFTSKIMMQLVIFLPLCALASLLLGVGGVVLWYEAVLLFFIMAASSLLSSALGLFIGLKKYNLHYTNEIQVIKQSSSVLVTMLIGIGLSISIFMLYSMFLFKYLIPIHFGAVVLLFLVLVSAALLYVIFKNCETKFREIS